MEKLKSTHQGEIEESGLIDLDELGVPSLELVFSGGPIIGLGRLDMLLAELDDLGQNPARDVGERDLAIGAAVLDQVFDRLRLHGERLVDIERLAVGAPEGDLLGGRHRFSFLMFPRRDARLGIRVAVANPNLPRRERFGIEGRNFGIRIISCQPSCLETVFCKGMFCFYGCFVLF